MEFKKEEYEYEKIFTLFFTIIILSGCTSTERMTSSYMNKLELGMSKKQVTSILGIGYAIAEKRIKNGIEVEVLSYRDYDIFYMFLFTNGKLEKWHRELLPKYEIVK